jgi:hypothetical protein
VLAALIARDVRSEIRSRKATYGRVRFKFSDDGISGADTEGSVFADEWARYAGFYVGRYVIVCPRIGSPVYLRIPIAGLVASPRREVEMLLSKHLPELSRDALHSDTNGRQSRKHSPQSRCGD